MALDLLLERSCRGAVVISVFYVCSSRPGDVLLQSVLVFLKMSFPVLLLELRASWAQCLSTSNLSGFLFLFWIFWKLVFFLILWIVNVLGGFLFLLFFGGSQPALRCLCCFSAKASKTKVPLTGAWSYLPRAAVGFEPWPPWSMCSLSSGPPPWRRPKRRAPGHR